MFYFVDTSNKLLNADLAQLYKFVKFNKLVYQLEDVSPIYFVFSFRPKHYINKRFHLKSFFFFYHFELS